jgi:hypothetical protein
MRLSAWFGILVGVMIRIQWTFFLITGSAPELQTEPRAITFHLKAEATMTLAMIAGGTAFLKEISCGRILLLLAFGMLIYCVINSPSYFGEQDHWFFMLMFFAILARTIHAIVP